MIVATIHPNTHFIPKISPSRSKADFFKRLGLLETNEEHKQIYRDMMDEAAKGRERTCQDPNNLTPQARNTTHRNHPYSSNMITETALHREVLNIYYTASTRTKPWYDLGRYHEGTNEENWIIRWCLWHVFRYRDERNRHRGQDNMHNEYKTYRVRRNSAQIRAQLEAMGYLSSDNSDRSEQSDQSDMAMLMHRQSTLYYDPVRDIHRVTE